MTAASYQPSTRAEGELETMGALSLDLSQATFELHSEQQPNTNTSFSNPLYMPVRVLDTLIHSAPHTLSNLYTLLLHTLLMQAYWLIWVLKMRGH